MSLWAATESHTTVNGINEIISTMLQMFSIPLHELQGLEYWSLELLTRLNNCLTEIYPM